MKFICLGGFKMSGGNSFALVCKDEALLVDCGSYIPEVLESDRHPAADSSIVLKNLPDLSLLNRLKISVIGLILTHIHGDHLIGVPKASKLFSTTIYTTRFTSKILTNFSSDLEIIVKNQNTSFKVGDIFKVTMIPVEHGVPEESHLYIETPEGTVYIASDWKLGYQKDVLSLSNLSQLDRYTGPTLLVDECVHVEQAGVSPRDHILLDLLKETVQVHRRSRVLVLISNSHVKRIGIFKQFAHNQLGREVAIVGKGLISSCIAAEVHLRDVKLALSNEELRMLDDYSKYLLIAGGPYGISGSFIDGMLGGDIDFRLRQGDVVIISSGQPTSIWARRQMDKMKNILVEKGVHLYMNRFLHPPNHAFSEEHRTLIEGLRPKNLVPYHGVDRKMKSFARLAKGLGFSEDRIRLPSNRAVLEIE